MKGFNPRALLFPLTILLALAVPAWAADAPPPIEAFARIPAIRNVAILPDGKQLMLIAGVDDYDAVTTLPADFSAGPKFVFASKPGDYDLSWCGWANNKRILCGVTATEREGLLLYGISRLVGVDADRTGYPAIYEVNVNTGRRVQRSRDYYPIRDYATDGAGNIRFGYGFRVSAT